MAYDEARLRQAAVCAYRDLGLEGRLLPVCAVNYSDHSPSAMTML